MTERSSADSEQAKLRRSRMFLIFGVSLILALAITFAAITMWALRIRAQTGQEFSNYTRTHNIGTAVTTDDVSGFQGDFCVVHLYHPIPEGQLESEMKTLFKTYQSMDGGDHLTVEYRAQNGQDIVQADEVAVDASHAVLTLHLSGGIRTVTQALPSTS